MRIKKPSGTKQEYKIYSNIEERDLASSKLENGQEVKVLDASSDENIGSGWAIYKYDKESSLFDLLEKEEQIEFPDPTIVATDEISIYKTTNDRLVSPDAMVSARTDMRILEDFDYSARVLGNWLRVEPIGGDRTVPVMVGGVKKYMSLASQSLTYTGFTNGGKGKRVHWSVSAYISDVDELKTNLAFGTIVTGEAISILPNSNDGILLFMQVSVEVPIDGSAPKPESFIIHKYWKKALAPAEERITIPEAGGEIVTDDYSIYQDVISEKNTLVVPSSYFSTTNDFRILEDFDYTVEQGYQGNSVVFSPVGGARNIPVLVEGVKKYMSINTEGVLFNLFGGSGKGRYNHIEIAATIRDNDDAVSNMTTYYNSGGEILLTKPKSGNTITLFQSRIYNPVDIADWNAEKISMWKYWKKALAPAEERMGVDWYGVSKDMSSEFPVCTRIGNMDLHRSLPVQSKMKRCLLWDNGTVHYYLDPNDSTKKTDGTAATLNGSHGQVMVEVPEYYYCYERIGTVCYYKISISPLEGFKRIKKAYISAYEASMQRSNSKLSSLINLDPDYRGGVNKSSDDANALKTGLGRPVGNELRSTLRNAGYNRGDNWHMYHVYNHYMLSMLFVIEYATFNSQLAFNSELDNSGFKQGGLGKGLTDGDSIGHMIAGMTAVVPCGITNSLGNNSGETTYNAIGLAMGTDQELTANSYRGIENPFGHMSKFVDGINSIASHGYVSEARKGLSDDVIEGFEYVGRLGTGNYITDVMDYILPLPKTTSGGSSTTFLCDLTSVNNNNSSVSLGGMLSSLDGSGLFNFQAAISTTPITYAGTRLCFTQD